MAQLVGDGRAKQLGHAVDKRGTLRGVADSVIGGRALLGLVEQELVQFFDGRHLRVKLFVELSLRFWSLVVAFVDVFLGLGFLFFFTLCESSGLPVHGSGHRMSQFAFLELLDFTRRTSVVRRNKKAAPEPDRRDRREDGREGKRDARVDRAVMSEAEDSESYRA